MTCFFFHSMFFVFYCRVCIHSISSERVWFYLCSDISLFSLYCERSRWFSWDSKLFKFIQSDHRVQSKCPNTAPLSQHGAILRQHIFQLRPHLSFITIHRIASFYLFSPQTIIQVSTEITKIIHHMNRTKHAHCSTTVLSTWQLTRAFTHFMQNSPHVLQNRLLK